MGLASVNLLLVQLVTDEREELILGDIFEVIATERVALRRLVHEPLENFAEGILPPLLIGNVIAESGLLVKLSERVCSLFEADLQAIKVGVCPVDGGREVLLHLR